MIRGQLWKKVEGGRLVRAGAERRHFCRRKGVIITRSPAHEIKQSMES